MNVKELQKTWSLAVHLQYVFCCSFSFSNLGWSVKRNVSVGATVQHPRRKGVILQLTCVCALVGRKKEKKRNSLLKKKKTKTQISFPSFARNARSFGLLGELPQLRVHWSTGLVSSDSSHCVVTLDEGVTHSQIPISNFCSKMEGTFYICCHGAQMNKNPNRHTKKQLKNTWILMHPSDKRLFNPSMVA